MRPFEPRRVESASASMRLPAALGLLALAAACGTTASNRGDPPTRRINPSRTPVEAGAPTENGGTGDAAGGGAQGASAAPNPGAAATPSAVQPGTAAAPAAPAAKSLVIATVAGQPIEVDELVETWLHRESFKVREYLEDLVISRLVVAEARRLGVSLSPELVEESMNEARAALEQEVERVAKGLTVEQFIEQALSLDVERYMAKLEEGLTLDLLTERCVRAWVLTNDHALGRVIVLEDRANVKELEKRIRAGEDFARLVEEFNTEDAGQEGGRIPAIVRGDSALSRLAFTTPVGQVGGPIFHQGNYLFLFIDARPETIAGTWAVVGPVVERSLIEQAVEQPEFWQWKMSLLDKYEVDMQPFLDFVGLPRPDADDGAGGQ